METVKPSKIYSALCAIMRETESISKDRRNQQQGFNFRGIDDVYNSLHPTFAKNGVVILPEVLEHRIEQRTTAKGGTAYAHFSKIKFHFIADDGSEVVATTVGEAADSGDKGASKAASIALKYALFQIFLIPTQDDDDDADKTAWNFTKQQKKTQQKEVEEQPRKFTADEEKAAKDWAEALDKRAFVATLAELKIQSLQELDYSRRPEFIKLCKQNAIDLKALDDADAKGGTSYEAE